MPTLFSQGRKGNESKGQEPILSVVASLDRNTDLRQWSRDLGPSELPSMAPRRTQSVLDVHQNNKRLLQEQRKPSPTSTLNFNASLLRLRGASVQVLSRIGVSVGNVNDNDKFEVSKNELWSTTDTAVKTHRPTVHENIMVQNKRSQTNPFLRSLGSGQDNNFLKTLIPGEEEQKTQKSSKETGSSLDKTNVPVVTKRENPHNSSAEKVNRCNGGRSASMDNRYTPGARILRKSIQSIVPSSFFRRTKSNMEAAIPLSDMSEHQLAQKIISDDEEWVQFQRALRERTASGKRICTHARLQHKLGTCMRESILNNEVAKGRQTQTSKNIDRKVMPSICGAHHEQLARRLKDITRQSSKSDFTDNKPQWKVVPPRRRRNSMASFFSSNAPY